MLIKNAQDWRNLGYYWAWANGSGRIFKRMYREGSPTINELMITGGYAHDTRESVSEWLSRSPFDKLEMPPNAFLYFNDFEQIQNYISVADVFRYLDDKGDQVDIYYLPKGKYLLRSDISEQSLLRFGVKRCSFVNRLINSMRIRAL